MPRVRPRTSRASPTALRHRPRWSSAFFPAIPRSRKTISARISSATERVFEKGALKTGMPRIVAASRSTWFVPMQKAPIAMSFRAAAISSAVSRVFERMPTKCTSAIASASSSPASAFGRRSTVV